jgi:hypothetical protein
MYIVSFDPGETTGIVVAQWESGRTFLVTRAEEMFWGERFSKVKRTLQTYKPSYTVVEAFRLYPHRAQSQIGKDFPSAQLIGIIQSYAYELGLLDSVVLQPAASRSSVKIAPEHKSVLGSSPHIKDAYAHVRYFIIVNLPKMERLKQDKP